MEKYKLIEEAFVVARQRIIFLRIPIAIISVVSVLYLLSISNVLQTEISGMLIYLIPAAALAACLGIYITVLNRKAIWKSYELCTSEDNLVQVYKKTKKTSIAYKEIKEIIETGGGKLLVISEKGKIINIPFHIEQRGRIMAKLSELKPIKEEHEESMLEHYSFIVGTVAIVLGILVYTLENKIAVSIIGGLLIAIVLWTFIGLQRDKATSRETKYTAWFLFLLIGIIASRLVMIYA